MAAVYIDYQRLMLLQLLISYDCYTVRWLLYVRQSVDYKALICTPPRPPASSCVTLRPK